MTSSKWMIHDVHGVYSGSDTLLECGICLYYRSSTCNPPTSPHRHRISISTFDVNFQRRQSFELNWSAPCVRRSALYRHGGTSTNAYSLYGMYYSTCHGRHDRVPRHGSRRVGYERGVSGRVFVVVSINRGRAWQGFLRSGTGLGDVGISSSQNSFDAIPLPPHAPGPPSTVKVKTGLWIWELYRDAVYGDQIVQVGDSGGFFSVILRVVLIRCDFVEKE